MENMQKNFELMTNDELQNTDGGFGILEGILAAATILGGYAVIREMVRDKGFNDAINGK